MVFVRRIDSTAAGMRQGLARFAVMAAITLAGLAFLVLCENVSLNRDAVLAERLRLEASLAGRAGQMAEQLEALTKDAFANTPAFEQIFSVEGSAARQIAGRETVAYSEFAPFVDAARARAAARDATALRGTLAFKPGSGREIASRTGFFVTSDVTQVWLVAVLERTPASDGVGQVPPVLVGVRQLDAALLREIGGDANIDGLRLVGSSEAVDSVLTLESPSAGRADTRLSWTARRPGDSFAANAGLALGLLAAVLAAAFGTALRQGLKIQGALPEIMAVGVSNGEAVGPGPAGTLPVTPGAGDSRSADLAGALVGNALRVHYLPVMSGDGTRIVAVEAQLCWQHPQRGLLRAQQFMPDVLDSSLALSLSQFVLRRTMADAVAWPALRLAVPLLAGHFSGRDFASRLRRCLTETGFDAARLECVLPQTALTLQSPHARSAMTDLRALGVQFCLSDVADGFGGLVVVRNYPFSRIQIDSATLHALGGRGEHAICAAAIVQLAHGLGLAVSALGVDTLSGQQFLQAAGCDELRGAQFSGALPAEFIDRLARSPADAMQRGQKQAA